MPQARHERDQVSRMSPVRHVVDLSGAGSCWGSHGTPWIMTAPRWTDDRARIVGSDRVVRVGKGLGNADPQGRPGFRRAPARSRPARVPREQTVVPPTDRGRNPRNGIARLSYEHLAHHIASYDCEPA